ncbi:MAG: bifunctional folylpolyglutamate synthase/dihydrofolate synthase, partial [Chitinivibrionales bacterium]
TNGKGSVSFFLESIFFHAGMRTGLYTSPHLVDVEERFRIGRSNAEARNWLSVYNDIEELCERLDLTFFEITTLIAFELFRREGTEFNVFETGLGGRFDATNVCAPVVSVITSVDIDHTEYLGNDLVSIASEKLGIVKPGIPLVISSGNKQEVLKEAEVRCREQGSEIIYASGYEGELRGPEFMRMNAGCAVEAARLCGIDIDFSKALNTTEIPGRFQVISVGDKDIIIDVAHNPQAVGVLCSSMKERFDKCDTLVIAGIMRDKEYNDMLRQYSGIADAVVCTNPGVDRAAGTGLLAEAAREWFNYVYEFPDIEIAFEKGLEMSYKRVLITGSFFTAGKAIEYLRRV